MYAYTRACMHACMHGCMDGWMDGWMDGCMHMYIYICVCLYSCIIIDAHQKPSLIIKAPLFTPNYWRTCSCRSGHGRGLPGDPKAPLAVPAAARRRDWNRYV